jgi:hypothetical protein
VADKTFDLGDYVQVKDRVAALFELYGKARIETTYELTSEPDGKPKVIARAIVWTSPDDPHPSTGTSWLYLPGSTPYTKGSEIENAETSAVGRAIGFLGILTEKSIATSNEIAGKQGQEETKPAPRDGSLIGTVEAAKPPHDLELRQTPAGPVIGFGLKEGRQIVRVLAHGVLAEQVAAFIEAVQGKRIEAFGTMTDESWTMGAGTAKERKIPYIALTASRITGPDGLDLPMHDGQTPEAAGPSVEGDDPPTTQPEAPQRPASETLCGNRGSLDTVCGLPSGHSGKHRELATDGRVLASW